MKYLAAFSCLFVLSGCFATGKDYSEPAKPESWNAYQSSIIQKTEAQALKSWWERFDDPALNALITLTLNDSPDRRIAEARILEARGVRRTARSSLFPQINGVAEAGREDDGMNDSNNFYEAGFDASFEIDVFGANRNEASARAKQVQALEAEYHDVTLSLVAEVARVYINYRAFERQVDIAQKNLSIQTQTLDLIRNLRDLGEAPQLDVERAENLVNTTRSSIPEFQRLADNARLQLTVLTGNLPKAIHNIVDAPSDIPGAGVEPVLIAPAEILAIRPDIRAAAFNFAANTDLAESATAEIFPTFTVGGFFGIADNAVINSASIWNVVAGAAVALLDFGRIEGQIDAARAREAQAYEQYRRTVLGAVTDVETALTDYTRINEQRISLQKAFDNADRALQLSQALFREGEISFLDVLDAQRTVNEADSTLITAESAQAESLVRLYKSLGVY